MDPKELDKTLEVLRKHGVASAEVPGWAAGQTLRVVFEPSVGPLPEGDPVTPGGWKSPTSLDRDPVADEERIP